MINSIVILNGFASELPAIARRKFTFSPGINAIFGSNGCGKSTILNCIKAYNGIKDGGWSKISEPNQLGATIAAHFPYAYRQYSPSQCDCIVTWDGTPTFYNDGDIKTDSFAFFFNSQAKSKDGLTTEEEQMNDLAFHPSSGQHRMKKLNKLLNMIYNPPLLIGGRGPEVDYIKSLPRTGRITLLLDEPERALSLPKQMQVFGVLVALAKDFQIIMSTHSPFVLFNKDISIIDMDVGYADECRSIIAKCANKTF